MEIFFLYLLKASGCVAIFYLAFLLIFNKDTSFKLQRFYLLSSLALTFLIASIGFSFRTTPENIRSGEISGTTAVNFEKTETLHPTISSELPVSDKITKTPFNYILLLQWIYGTVTALILLRLLTGFIKLAILLIQSEKTRLYNTRVYMSQSINGSANIFGFIFLNPGLRNDPELPKIIIHENIHASQYHSIDIFLVELLAAAMWFNPVVWMMRRSLQQLHEYLADEGVLRSGINKLEYQKLLINHIAEDSLVLSSGFKSSIKKRIIMMTKTNANKPTKLKLIALLPITAGLFIGISFINPPVEETQYAAVSNDTLRISKFEPVVASEPNLKVVEVQPTQAPAIAVENEKPNVTKAEPVVAAIPAQSENVSPQEPPVAAVELTKMNVLYLGVDNPVKIAVSNHSPAEIKVALSNGSISLVDGGNYYVARPKMPGNAVLSIFVGDKLIGKQEYRVKRVPDPVAKVAGKKGGVIDKNLLAAQMVVQADMENFDFDLRFAVTGFTVTTNTGGKIYEETSTTNKLTAAQLDLINKAESNQKIYFEDIKCVGPDGTVRELSPIAFEIK